MVSCVDAFAPYIDWLQSEKERTILIEAEYATGTEALFCNNGSVPCNSTDAECNTSVLSGFKRTAYFSNIPYISYYNERFNNVSGLEVQNIIYDDIVYKIPNINSKLDTSAAIGSIQLLNTQGEYDYLLNYAWEGRPVRIYIGDQKWYRNKFAMIFEGVCESLIANQHNFLNFNVKNSNRVIEVECQETTINQVYVDNLLNSSINFPVKQDPGDPDWVTGTYTIPETSVDKLVPISLGKVFNVEPVLLDLVNHVYQVHEGYIVDIPEVRSNGVPLDPSQYQIDADIGCFRLLDNPNDTQITCDVVGTDIRATGFDPNYSLTAHSSAFIIEWLALSKTELTSDRLCEIYFPTFDTEHPDPVGIYIAETLTVREAIEALMSTWGGFYRFSKLGMLQILQLTDPALAAEEDVVLEVKEDSILENGVTLSSIEVPKHVVTLGYHKNWTVQDQSSLAGVLVDANGDPFPFPGEDFSNGWNLVELYSNEYSTISQNPTNLEAKALYPLSRDTEPISTLLFEEGDNNIVTSEANRRGQLRSVKRFVYKVQSTAVSFTLNIGDIIKVEYPRFGFNDGRQGIIVGMSEKISTNRVDLEVWL